MDASGFRYRTNMAWIKQTRRLGTGNFWRNGHELLLLGLRGDAGGFLDKTLVSHFTAPPGRHSEKPEVVRERIERAVPGPFVELFARSRREGWDVIWATTSQVGGTDDVTRRLTWTDDGATVLDATLDVPLNTLEQMAWR